MSGPADKESGYKVTPEQVRNEVRRYAFERSEEQGRNFIFLPSAQNDDSTIGLGQRIVAGLDDEPYVNALVELYSNPAISERTKREFALDYLHDSVYVNKSYNRLAKRQRDAEAEVNAGEGSEYARVQREHYIRNQARTAGRRQTILTAGRV